MTTTFPTTSTNRHIESLETVFAESNASIEWLVIAHNDVRMVRSLSKALSGQSAAVLEVSQDTWNFETDELPEALEWALQQGAIRNVVLAGHSQAGGPASRASLVASEKQAESQRSYDRLITGVQRANAQKRESQKKFATQVQQLSQIPVVHDRWANNELAVYGLFYRAESGSFLAYDAEQDDFRPLMS